MTMTHSRAERSIPPQRERLRQRRLSLAAQVVGAALLVAGIVLALMPGSAEASTLIAGPVTVTPGSPYHSGQTINISVSANSTLSEASRAQAGFPSGAVAIKVVECGDPGGLMANLPTKAAECDYNTVDSIPAANADGSFVMEGYVTYALPDSIIFGETADQKPVCGSGDNECVLGIFTNLNDFTKPHIFSGPFNVTPDVAAENAIVNETPATSPTAGAGKATGATTPAATLASTGANGGLPWLIGFGALFLLVGTLGRRRLSRLRVLADGPTRRDGAR